jgi:hypothetical protein
MRNCKSSFGERMDKINDVLVDVLNAKVYEPQRRNKDGMRWIKHRFPPGIWTRIKEWFV